MGRFSLVTFLGLTLACLGWAPARAAVTAETANVLALQCQAVNPADRDLPLGQVGSPDAVQCLGYIIGIFDTLRAFSMNSMDKFVCVPDTAIPETSFAKIFLDWYARNPQDAGLYPTGPVIASLVEAFPCRQRQERRR